MEPGRAFTGLLFRAQDEYNGEVIYIRHHQQGNPDAWQYHPKYNDHQAYQIYQGEGFAGVALVRMGEWVSAELIVNDDQALLRIDGEVIAAVGDLQRDAQSGRLGVWALRGERRVREVSFSQDAEHLTTSIPIPPIADAPEGLIDEWSFSQIMSEADAHDVLKRSAANYAADLSVGHRNLVDMAPLATIEPGLNTIIASVSLQSPSDQMVLLNLAFSDKASVFLNGQWLYAGSDIFRSRDYRFLGTAGFYDTVPLYLKSGENTLEIAVTEQEGGWTVGGILREATDVTVRPRE